MIVVTRTWIALTVLALMVSMLAPGVASAQDDDFCASTLVDMIRQAGLDVEQSAPALGCHQAEDGSWYMPTVADLADETVMSQLDPDGTQILAAVDRMATDQAFANSVLFERTDALIMVPGIGGVYERIDASAYGIGSAPTWLHSYQDSYNQAVQLYLTRTAGTEVDLVLYMQWMMARRDATLGAMATIQNPMAATAFLANGGYQQFPWPWQLADPTAFAAFTGQGPLDLDPVQGDSTGQDATLSILIQASDGSPLSGACVFVIDAIENAGGHTTRVCDNDSVDANDEVGRIDFVVPPESYRIGLSPLPTGYVGEREQIVGVVGGRVEVTFRSEESSGGGGSQMSLSEDAEADNNPGVVFTPLQVSALPGETVHVIIQPQVREDLGSFLLEVTVPDGLQVMGYPTCFGLYPNTCTIQSMTLNADQSLLISATGLYSPDDRFELGLDIRIADHLRVGSSYVVTAEIQYVAGNNPAPTEESTLQITVG